MNHIDLILLKSGDSKSIVARSRSNFSSSFLFLPKEKREALRRVYAFFRVIDDVVEEEANPIRKRELLESWKQELENTYRGIPIVPLLKELKQTIDRFSIPKEFFLLLIKGCEMDITKNRYANFSELYEYCYHVASVVGLVCMRIFEYQSATSDKTAINLGIALQLTNILRDVGSDMDKGRIYLPQDEMKQCEISENDLINKTNNIHFESLFNLQYERAKSYYNKARGELTSDSSGKLLAAKIMATVYETILDKIKRLHYPVLHQRVGLNLFQKFFILTRIFFNSSFL